MQQVEIIASECDYVCVCVCVCVLWMVFDLFFYVCSFLLPSIFSLPPDLHCLSSSLLYLSLSFPLSLSLSLHVLSFSDSLDKVFADDKQPNYSEVITQLLQQLDCAMSTTQKCLTKDTYEKNPR